LEEATFRYFPEELFGLIEALKQMSGEMASNSFQRTPNGAAKH
jgi:hypothetical protein